MKMKKMNRIRIALFALLGAITGALNAQNSSVVFVVNPAVANQMGQEVTYGEFKRQFLKNINLDERQVTAAEIDEYLQLYIRFKLKIQDAVESGQSENSAYLQELGMYREQLARNYLYDRQVTADLIEEAYDRMRSEVRVSHILIACPRGASAQTEAQAKGRMEEIYQQLRRNNTAENFASMAETNSDDPGTKSAGGDLGWMTAMQVVYEFENYAYNTPVGDISPVFRTDFGYHVLRVTAKRPNRGDVKVRHILIRVTAPGEEYDDAALKKMEEIRNQIVSGQASFEEMARNYSEDYNSRYNGGIMDYVNTTQYIGDPDRQLWVDKAFSMTEKGEISSVFRTNYGYHLLQLVDVRPMASFDQMRSSLKQQVQQNARSKVSIDALVEKVKRENNFTENPQAYQAFLTVLDSSFLNGSFDMDALPKSYDNKGKRFNLLDMELFRLGNESYTVEDFALFIQNNRRAMNSGKAEAFASEYQQWVSESCVANQNEHLEERSEEFRDIYQEYREGILMFNRMQQLVWDRANNDSAGLAQYFAEHRDAYRWDDRYHVDIYYCSDAKMMKTVAKQVKKGVQADSLLRMHTRNNPLGFNYRMGYYQWSDTGLVPNPAVLNTLFSNSAYKSQTGLVKLNQVGEDWILVNIHGFLPAGPKALSECRGPVTSRYQEELERRWMDELENRYEVSINYESVEALKKELNAR
ncbi:MAG: foldase protein PrsA [Bacteroidia bacterium]